MIPAVPLIYRLGFGAVLVASAWFYVTDLRHDRDRARQEAAEARSAERAAQAQADLNATASEAVEAAQGRSLSITVRAQELGHAVSVAPGGDAVVPSAVLELWRSGIEQLRDEAAAHAGADGPGGGDAAGAVPEAPDPR